MLGLSFAELLVILGVALFFIKLEDVPHIIKFVRDTKNKAIELKNELIAAFSDIEELKEIKEEIKGAKEEIKTIIDLDGNPQRAYNIDEVSVDIKKAMDEFQQKQRN